MRTEVLRLAASVDQMSPHVLAEAIVTEALTRGVPLSLPVTWSNNPAAASPPRSTATGSRSANCPATRWPRGGHARRSTGPAWTRQRSRGFVDGEPAGAVLLRDPLRRNAPRTVRRLRAAGLNRLVMLTGDRAEPAREIATVLGLDEVYADQSPADKVAAVRAEQDRAVTVMVGDGVNDAPALAAATVGVAMGARGATASSEAADIVLTTDRSIVSPTRWISPAGRGGSLCRAPSSGMGLSLLAMVIAALGWLPPAAGALLQEGIDVAVILNALRALRGNPAAGSNCPPRPNRCCAVSPAEHDELRETIGLLRDAADRLAAGADPAALESLTARNSFLTDGFCRTNAPRKPSSIPRWPPARKRRSHGHHEPHPRRNPTARRRSARTSLWPSRPEPSSPTRSKTCSLVFTGCTRCCGCTSFRRKRTISPSQRTNPRPPKHAARRSDPTPRRSLRAEFLSNRTPFTTLKTAQQTLDNWLSSLPAPRTPRPVITSSVIA